MEMYQIYQLLQLLLRLMVYTLIGQGVLALLIGERRGENFVYRFFAKITRPVLQATKRITFGRVPDRLVGFIAVGLLLALNLGLYMLFYSQGWIGAGVSSSS